MFWVQQFYAYLCGNAILDNGLWLGSYFALL